MGQEGGCVRKPVCACCERVSVEHQGDFCFECEEFMGDPTAAEAEGFVLTEEEKKKSVLRKR
ncbi:MAG: hypothetical protein Q8R36_04670 [bacterium]|nr:hypothetical protein [bacterium]